MKIDPRSLDGASGGFDVFRIRSTQASHGNKRATAWSDSFLLVAFRMANLSASRSLVIDEINDPTVSLFHVLFECLAKYIRVSYHNFEFSIRIHISDLTLICWNHSSTCVIQLMRNFVIAFIVSYV